MKTTKKVSHKRGRQDELAAHYDFDYSKAKPNRFAGLPKDQMVVLLDKELSDIFRSPEEVTNALRSLIRAFPPKIRQRKKAA
jgi:hypothetical protein